MSDHDWSSELKKYRARKKKERLEREQKNNRAIADYRLKPGVALRSPTRGPSTAGTSNRSNWDFPVRRSQPSAGKSSGSANGNSHANTTSNSNRTTAEGTGEAVSECGTGQQSTGAIVIPFGRRTKLNNVQVMFRPTTGTGKEDRTGDSETPSPLPEA